MIEKIAEANKQPLQNKPERTKELEQQILEEENFIKKVCYKMLGNTDRAEELANEALYKAFSSAARYDESKGSLKNWLATIAKNTVRDYLRRIKINPTREKRAESIEDHLNIADENLNPEELLIDREKKVIQRELVKKVMEVLPKEFKEILQMDFAELSMKEMAKKLKIPETTTRSRLFRARRELAKRMGQDSDFILKRGRSR